MLIQKYLAMCGITSRRKAEKMIKQKRIKVNGTIINTPFIQIDPKKDKITLDNTECILKNKNKTYIILNKPIGYITSKKDKFGSKNIYDLLPSKYKNLFYAGRLDKLSCGLIVLSNDGDFINYLTHPRYQHEKEYIVCVDKKINNELLNKLQKGIYIKNTKENDIKKYGKFYKTLPTTTKYINDKCFSIILKEGKNQQIRRMCNAIGLNVTYLKRIRINNIYLGNLKEGKYKIIKVNNNTFKVQ